MLVLSKTVLVIVIDSSGRRGESGTEDQTGANCLADDSTGDKIRIRL